MVNQIFELLASDNSRNFKLDVLKQHKDNELLKRVIFLALDPFTQFYIRKIPKYEQLGNHSYSLAEAIEDLKSFSSRKLTGNAAIGKLQAMLSVLSTEDAKVIERIIQKDLKCGVSDATVNAIWPDLIPEYPCMLASAYEQKLVDKVVFPAYVQLKLDGMRFNAIVRSGTVEFRSRNGKEIQIADTTFKEPFLHMASFYGCDMVFDGELLVADIAGNVLDRKTGNGILNKAVKGTQTPEEGAMVRATVWDAITFENFQKGIDTEVYKDRFAKLSNSVSDLKHRSNYGNLVSVVPSKKVESIEEAREIFENYLIIGEEGIILKAMDMPWENKRSKKQIKFKGELECDMKVTGVEPGTGKNVGKIGALICESEDGVVKVSVGSGLTDSERSQWSEKDLIGRIITVKYNARIQNKQGGESLFLPIFIELRSDKANADYAKDIK